MSVHLVQLPSSFSQWSFLAVILSSHLMATFFHHCLLSWWSLVISSFVDSMMFQVLTSGMNNKVTTFAVLITLFIFNSYIHYLIHEFVEPVGLEMKIG